MYVNLYPSKRQGQIEWIMDVILKRFFSLEKLLFSKQLQTGQIKICQLFVYCILLL